MSEKNETLSGLHGPNSYIGRTIPRPNAKRLLGGRGTYTDDITLPRMVQVAFLRSPHAHATIKRIETSYAEQSPGVIRVFDGKDITAI